MLSEKDIETISDLGKSLGWCIAIPPGDPVFGIVIGTRSFVREYIADSCYAEDEFTILSPPELH